MLVRNVEPGRILMGRLETGDDLLNKLTEICVEENITHGQISAIGALARATVGFYDGVTREYNIVDYPDHCELVSLQGNISLKEERPFVHAHISIADRKGAMLGGHLFEGCTVFACEWIIRELTPDKPLERTYHQLTGLSLW